MVPRWYAAATPLLLLLLLLPTAQAQSAGGNVPLGERHPPSPCPAVFSYENDRTWNTRWYGLAQFDTLANRAFTLQILLDRKADLLGSWAGTVSSEDNETFELQHPAPGTEPVVTRVSVRFFVNFPRGGPVPRLTDLWKDSQRLCGSSLWLSSQDNPSASTPPTLTRPPTRPPNRTGSRPNTRPPGGFSSPSPTPVATRPPNTTPSGLTRPNTRPTRIGVTTVPTLPPFAGLSTHSVRPPPSRPTSRPTGLQITGPGSSGVGVSSPDECGKIDIRSVPFVVNGQNTYHGEWPWHVAIYSAGRGNPTYSCGGTLISKRAILTAGHCVTNKDNGRLIPADQLIVYLGKHSLPYGWTTSEGVQAFTPERIIRHPTYNGNELTGDIALIMLDQDANTTSYVRKICMWPRTETTVRMLEGQVGTVVGWGYDSQNVPTPDLQKSGAQVRSYEECVRSNPEFFSRYLVNKTFCAGFGNGTSPCNGDSGGGMVLKRSDDRWYIRGIVSNGVPRRDNPLLCSPEHYTVFVDVAQYRPWLAEHVSDLSTNSPAT